MEQLLTRLLDDPTIPAWFLCVAFAAFVVEYLARGKTGQFLADLLKGIFARKRSREDALFAILREALEEQGREAAELEDLLRKTREDVLAAVSSSDKESSAMLEPIRERLVNLDHQAKALRGMMTALNASLSHLTDRTSDELATGAVKRAEIMEKLNSIGAYLLKKER